MTTFTIDTDNNITAHAVAPAAQDNVVAFATAKELAKATADWPASRLVEIWNAFAGEGTESGGGLAAGEQEDLRAIFASAAQATATGMRQQQGPEKIRRKPSCSPAATRSHWRGAGPLTVTPITKRFVHRFPPEAIELIRQKNLDVLIRFGFNILRGEILQSARYGVWSYHHGDNDFYRGGPAYFWEVYEGNPTSGTILQVLTEELDRGHVLCKGYYATQLGISCARNRVQPYWGSSTFLIEKLQQLHMDGWGRVETEMVAPAPYQGKTKVYTAPGNWQMVRWLAPALCRKGAQKAWQSVRRSRTPH